MKEFIAWLVANLDSIIAVLVSVVGAFSMIATMTPNKSDDKIAQFILDIVNFLGANFGKAANEEKSNANSGAGSSANSS